VNKRITSRMYYCADCAVDLTSSQRGRDYNGEIYCVTLHNTVGDTLSTLWLACGVCNGGQIVTRFSLFWGKL